MKRSIFLFFIFLAITIPLFLSAESRNVVINEIAWMGTPVAGVEEKQWWRYEWVELYNSADTVGMLDGWTLELYRDKLDFTVSLKGTILPNGYYVAGASEKISNLDLNYKNLGGKFFNGGQKIVLKNSLGEIIDELDATSGWPAGDNKTKQTMERIQGSDPCIDVQGSEPCETIGGAKAWQTSALAGGTPKAQNSEGVILERKGGTVPPLSWGNPSINSGQAKKDPSGSFQQGISVVHPLTLVAGLLALGSSGALLLVKRHLALRQARAKKNQKTSS